MVEIEFWLREHGRIVYLMDETNAKAVSDQWEREQNFEFTAHNDDEETIVAIKYDVVDFVEVRKIETH